MSTLSTLTVTLKDDAAEQTFVTAFAKALEATQSFPGLESLVAAKVLGAERTYHLHTVWESDEAMNAWQSNPGYSSVRDAFDASLVSAIDIARWTSI